MTGKIPNTTPKTASSQFRPAVFAERRGMIMKDAYHKYFNDFVIGEKILSGGRQITDSDERILLGMIGADHPLHTDPIYCAGREDVKTPIASGSLILGFIDGQFYRCVCRGDEVTVIPDGYQKIRFLKPIHIGDTVRAEYEITALEDVDPRYGRVTAAVNVLNQDGTLVTFAAEHFIIEKEGATYGTAQIF